MPKRGAKKGNKLDLELRKTPQYKKYREELLEAVRAQSENFDSDEFEDGGHFGYCSEEERQNREWQRERERRRELEAIQRQLAGCPAVLNIGHWTTMAGIAYSALVSCRVCKPMYHASAMPYSRPPGSLVPRAKHSRKLARRGHGACRAAK